MLFNKQNKIIRQEVGKYPSAGYGLRSWLADPEEGGFYQLQ